MINTILGGLDEGGAAAAGLDSEANTIALESRRNHGLVIMESAWIGACRFLSLSSTVRMRLVKKGVVLGGEGDSRKMKNFFWLSDWQTSLRVWL